MRLLLGIILGAVLTVGGAYLYDSHHAMAAIDTPASAQRPMVNWDVVGTKWHHLTERARSEWARVTANIDAERAVRSQPRG
ncbi:MAG TPA: hypothetical protein VFC54_13910 [Pseudolabrys sp.]|nr:hypothetical protein [Pseudolabrys sp.]